MANESSATVSIRLGNGAGSLSGMTDVSVGASPLAVVVGDFNQDGKQDLAAASRTPNTITIRLGQCDLPPPITAGATATRQQGTTGSTATIATVSDDLTTAGAITVTATTVPTGITVTNIVNTNGTITATIAADCSATTGNNMVVLTATDGSLMTTANLTVNVTANSPPTVGTYANTTLAPNGSTTVTPNAALADNGSIVSVTATASPNTFTGTFLGNRVTGAVTINNAGPLGTYTVTVTVSDNCKESTQQTFTLTVGEMPVLGAKVGDPAVCLDPGGLVGNEATLPANLTAVAGTCAADVPGTCTIAANGGSVSWNGLLPANTTVTMIYRSRISANTPNGTEFTIQNNGSVGGALANFDYKFTLSCPVTINTQVAATKAGSVLVFPYYTSTIGGASDTRLTISNISNAASTVANQTYVHLFLIDGTSCQPSDLFLCLTPNASFSFKASDYDPGNTGYVLAVAIDKQGVPLNNNVLIGNAFVTTPQFADNYGAESFAANSFAVATVSGNTATLYFDQVGYDAVPKQLTTEIQSPIDAAGQQVVTAGLSGDLTTSSLSDAAQVGTGQAYNEKEVFGSFNGWLMGTCQAKGTISTASPRVPNGLGNLIKTGRAGSLKFNVGAAVGLLLTPRTATWKGIRSLHKTQAVATTLTIPIFVPVC